MELKDIFPNDPGVRELNSGDLTVDAKDGDVAEDDDAASCGEVCSYCCR
jgi:hypothetical protein